MATCGTCQQKYTIPDDQDPTVIVILGKPVTICPNCEKGFRETDQTDLIRVAEESKRITERERSERRRRNRDAPNLLTQEQIRAIDREHDGDDERITLPQRGRRGRPPWEGRDIELQIHVSFHPRESHTISFPYQLISQAIGLTEFSPAGLANFLGLNRTKFRIIRPTGDLEGFVSPPNAEWVFSLDQANPVGFVLDGHVYTFPPDSEVRTYTFIHAIGEPIRLADASDISFIAANYSYNDITSAIIKAMCMEGTAPDYPPFYSLQNNEGFLKEYFLREHYAMTYIDVKATVTSGRVTILRDIPVRVHIVDNSDGRREQTVFQMVISIEDFANIETDAIFEAMTEPDREMWSLSFDSNIIGRFMRIDNMVAMTTVPSPNHVLIEGYIHTRTTILEHMIKDEFTPEQWEHHSSEALRRVQHPHRGDNILEMIPVLKNPNIYYQSRITITHLSERRQGGMPEHAGAISPFRVIPPPEAHSNQLPLLNGSFIQSEGANLIIVIFDHEYFGSWARFWNDTRRHPHYQIVAWGNTLGARIPGVSNTVIFHRYGSYQLTSVENLTDESGIDIMAIKLIFEHRSGGDHIFE